MALTPYGFTGSINNVQWAKVTEYFGAKRLVDGVNDFKVETVIGQDRTVRILGGTPSAPARAFAHGVLVEADANETVQLPTISGGSRWDLVVLRRNWQTSSVSIAVVQGGSAQVEPAERNKTPGTIDDQPLALVRVTAGSQLPTQILDWRTFAPSKRVSATTLQAILDPDYGLEVDVSGRVWRYDQVSAQGVLSPRALPRTFTGRASDTTSSAGEITVAQAFGAVPTAIQVTPSSLLDSVAAAMGSWQTFNVNENGFSVRFRRRDTGGPFAANPVNFYWTVTV